MQHDKCIRSTVCDWNTSRTISTLYGAVPAVSFSAPSTSFPGSASCLLQRLLARDLSMLGNTRSKTS